MTGMLIAGTSSDAGKSLFVTGLCRVARRLGVDVAPFKAQNMSNNSMVCADGSEIGRAQYLQANAAGLEPASVMNPVLLKPGTDRRSFIVLRGQSSGTLEAGEYSTGRRRLAAAAWDSYEELAATHDLVICEGAGSPAEINLRRGDYTNMGLARRFNLPVVLIGDIDRGGVLASIFGTWGLLDDQDRALLSGYVINKFRGDQSILDPGLTEITRRTGLPNLGVLPWLEGVWLDGEDSLSLGNMSRNSLSLDDGKDGDQRPLSVAVVRLPRISNATDVDALAQEPGVQVVVTTNPADVVAADLAIIPGSRSTLSDLEWLHRSGNAGAIRRRARVGTPILGICGGFQMLTREIDDNVESDDNQPGLGLLPARVRFHPDKTLRRPHGTWQGHPVEGYEIHHGTWLEDEDARTIGAEDFLAGLQLDHIWGTMWHGSMESDAFRRAWLREVARQAGRAWEPRSDAPGFGERREQMINTTADAIESAIDVEKLLGLAH